MAPNLCDSTKAMSRYHGREEEDNNNNKNFLTSGVDNNVLKWDMAKGSYEILMEMETYMLVK